MKRAIVIALTAVATAGAAYWLSGGALTPAQTIQPRRGPAEDSHVDSSASKDSRHFADIQAEAEEGARTLEEQLRGLWGPGYSDKLARTALTPEQLQGPSIDFDWDSSREDIQMHFRVGEKERAALVANYVNWPAVVDKFFVGQLAPKLPEFALDESVLLAVAVIAEPFNRDLEREAQLLVKMIDAAKRAALDNEHFEKSLLLPLEGRRPDAGEMLYATSGKAGPWGFRYAIHSTTNPEIPDQKQRIRSLQKARRNAIRDFLDTLR